jgi:DNA-binding Lrp family transcriptional regulator
MNELIETILSLFSCQKSISLKDLADVVERSEKVITNAIKMMKKDYIITTTGKKSNPIYTFHGTREEAVSTKIVEKIKVVKEVVKVSPEIKGPQFDECSPAKALLRDCFHLVMASRLRGPVTEDDVIEWFNMDREIYARTLMYQTVDKYPDLIKMSNVKTKYGTIYRLCMK